MKFFAIVILVVLAINQLTKVSPPKVPIQVDCKFSQVEIDRYLNKAYQQED
jgi:hypothetical protein